MGFSRTSPSLKPDTKAAGTPPYVQKLLSNTSKQMMITVLTGRDMHEHLEVGALLGEVAEVLHPHHVHIQGNIIPTSHACIIYQKN